MIATFPDRLLPRIESLSDLDRKDVDWILDAADAWNDGMPIAEFARIGQIVSPRTGRESPEYSRWVAVFTTSPADPRRALVLRAMDELLRLEGFQITRFGLFHRQTLRGAA